MYTVHILNWNDLNFITINWLQFLMNFINVILKKNMKMPSDYLSKKKIIASVDNHVVYPRSKVCLFYYCFKRRAYFHKILPAITGFILKQREQLESLGCIIKDMIFTCSGKLRPNMPKQIFEQVLFHYCNLIG